MNIYRKVKKYFDQIYNKIIISHFNIQVGRNVIINGCLNVKGNKNAIIIEDNCILNSDVNSVPLGYQPSINLWCFNEGKIIIGMGSGISNASLCSAKKIIIGKNVLIGGGVKIFDTDFHSLQYNKRIDIENDTDRKSAKVEIRDGAFIGAGVIILKGVIIGEKSIVAAGSVVTKSIPSGQIWGGNPAKFIKVGVDDSSL